MNIKRLIFGEPCPDMDDPKLSKQRKEFNSYGERFARFIKLDKITAWLQAKGQENPKRFLTVIIGIMCLLFFWNIFRLAYLTANYNSSPSTAVEKVDKAMKDKHIIGNKSKINEYGK
ncbi:MAG: hypothetical protein ACI3ZD_01055 [Prevotella sp.]